MFETFFFPIKLSQIKLEMNAETHIGHPKWFLKLSDVNEDTAVQFFVKSSTKLHKTVRRF